MVFALAALGLATSVARADDAEREYQARQADRASEQGRQQRQDQEIRQARERDRLRETERARRTRDNEQRAADTTVRVHDARDAARVHTELENDSLVGAREAEREHKAERARSAATAKRAKNDTVRNSNR
jgi:hypothetical protein